LLISNLGIDSWHLQGAIYLSKGTPATNLLDTEIPTHGPAVGELGTVASGGVRASDNGKKTHTA